MSEQARLDHLLRRTGFGVTQQQRRNALRLGYRKTVQELIRTTMTYKLAKRPPVTPFPELVVPATLVAFAQGITWWMDIMATTTSPLNERLTMFWHRHFATSGAKCLRTDRRCQIRNNRYLPDLNSAKSSDGFEG